MHRDLLSAKLEKIARNIGPVHYWKRVLFRKFIECLLHIRLRNPVIVEADWRSPFLACFLFLGGHSNIFLAPVDVEGLWSGLTILQAGD